jgi:hypothetical protein
MIFENTVFMSDLNYEKKNVSLHFSTQKWYRHFLIAEAAQINFKK